MPHLRPAEPITRASATSIGINSSQIQAVPHSAIQSVLRNKNAPSATGLVNSPITKSTPNVISVRPYIGPVIVA